MADMVPDEIEPAERVGRLAHDVAGEVVAGQVAGDPDRLAAGSCYLADDRFHPGCVEIDHRDRGAFTREPQCAGAPHTRSGGSDDADLALQAHGFLLFSPPTIQAVRSRTRDGRGWRRLPPCRRC
jgi:hypothetical protein